MGLACSEIRAALASDCSGLPLRVLREACAKRLAFGSTATIFKEHAAAMCISRVSDACISAPLDTNPLAVSRPASPRGPRPNPLAPSIVRDQAVHVVGAKHSLLGSGLRIPATTATEAVQRLECVAAELQADALAARR